MRILVTGHDGYIGTVLAPMLVAAGHEVVGLDAYWFERCALFPHAEAIETVRLDIRDATRAHLEGFEVVVHLAALCNDPLGDLNPRCTEAINHRAAVAFAGLAKAAGVERFVHASSCSLYGAMDDTLIDESAPFNPVSVYGRSKVLAERGISALADDDFSPTHLRFATAYGVSPKLRADLVVNNLVGYAVITGEVLLKSDGQAWRPLVHVEDIARAVIAACEAPRSAIHDQAFNVGSTAENYKVHQIAELVAAAVPESRVRYADRGFRDARNYRVSCEKIRERIPDFRPRWNLARGIAEVAHAFTRHGVDYADFTGPRLERLAHLKQLVGAHELDAELLRTGDGAPVLDG